MRGMASRGAGCSTRYKCTAAPCLHRPSLPAALTLLLRCAPTGTHLAQVGEVIGEAGGPQYEVYAAHGRGVFSSVLRARDLARRNCDTGTCPEVAIKVC